MEILRVKCINVLVSFQRDAPKACLLSEANVRPVYLQEMYRQLTGDTSAASSECEKDIDERLQQALGSKDPDIVVDLRHHSKGHPNKYDKFWEACA